MYTIKMSADTNNGGVIMSDKQDIWQKKRAQTSVNPQGLSEDEKDHQPKSQLEQRAKKKNTKL